MSASKRPPGAGNSVKPPKRDPNWEKEQFNAPADLFDVDEFTAKHVRRDTPPKFSLEGSVTDKEEITVLRAHFGRHEWEKALSLAEAVLKRRAGNVEATYVAEQCRARQKGLADFLTLRAAQIPERSAETPILSLKLDHRAGFLLSLVDGSCTTEMILDISGLPPEEGGRLMYGLVLDGVIQFR
jgi:hypothetical protein